MFLYVFVGFGGYDLQPLSMYYKSHAVRGCSTQSLLTLRDQERTDTEQTTTQSRYVGMCCQEVKCSLKKFFCLKIYVSKR